jgi:hypothetical protein
MRIVATLIGLLFSTVAVADPTQKAIADIRDMASLIAADYNKCGVVRMERAIDYLGAMSTIIATENPDVDLKELELGQLMFFEEAYITADKFIEVNGCDNMNLVIDRFSEGMNYTRYVWDFYTPLETL